MRYLDALRLPWDRPRTWPAETLGGPPVGLGQGPLLIVPRPITSSNSTAFYVIDDGVLNGIRCERFVAAPGHCEVVPGDLPPEFACEVAALLPEYIEVVQADPPPEFACEVAAAPPDFALTYDTTRDGGRAW